MTDARLVRPSWRGRTNIDALTIACIEHAEALAGHPFAVTQGSYQGGAGDPKSAGTHDGGGVVDLSWCAHDACVGHLRRAGFAAWHRQPPSFDHHFHAVVIGHPLLAPAAARQVANYLAGRNGLANNGPDDGPRFDPIPRPIWPYPEDDMFSDEDRALLRETKVAAEKAAAQAERARKGSYERDKKLPGLVTDKVLAVLAASPVSTDGISADDIEEAVKSAIRDLVAD